MARMRELRWNPLLREWVAVATERQDRPQMPADWCPFCPGSGRVPDNYDVHIYPNDFPAFHPQAEAPEPSPDALYRSAVSTGACDVVLYHPDHHARLEELPLEHIEKVVALWRRRFTELAADPRIRYVFIFENRGEVIGVTMPHPHGQIYAYPFLPPRIERELESARAHRAANGRCLWCDLLAAEIRDGRRLVAENASWVAGIPYFARWPYEVHLTARRHLGALPELTATEERDLAAILKRLLLKYDALFGFPLPLMMVLHQAPVNGEYPEWHFHFEFYPPHRSATKLKYLAGVESGAGVFLNDNSPEEKAAELRAAGE
jgi:UDPglucose--hexose-1-phosphate uridylyltransferase